MKAERRPRAPRWLIAVALTSALLPAARADDPHRVLAGDGGPAWASLTPAQRSALAPLQGDWAAIDAARRQKWLEVAARFPSMSGAERERIQQRMAEWARMTPQQRATARLQFQEARQISPEDRTARWEAYQSLSEERRRELQQRAAPPTHALPRPSAAAPADAGAAKRNIVDPPRRAPARPVTPTVVQSGPGATTTLMSSPKLPPPHAQAGLPKIAATEGFVDRRTLLPQRGPQGAAAQPSGPARPRTAAKDDAAP